MFILPAVAARLWASSLGGLLALSATFGAIGSLLGYVVGIRYDLPSGPAMVGTLGCVLMASAVVRRVADRPRGGRLAPTTTRDGP
jgi:zinc/manganese transport system permease protein